MRYKLSTLFLLTLCGALATAWFVTSNSNLDKNRLANNWLGVSGTNVLLAFDTRGTFSKKEYDPSSGLTYTQYDGTYEVLNDSSITLTVNASREYSFSGGEDWSLDQEETNLEYEACFQFAINGSKLVLARTGGPWRGPHGGAFTLDGG